LGRRRVIVVGEFIMVEVSFLAKLSKVMDEGFER